MSGHSKWNNIKRTKEKSDAVKGKIFTKIGRELAVIVKLGGADPNTNARLKDAITKAKQNNMPSDTIARCIKKASGEGSGVNYEELFYEGYGIGGSAVMVKCLTDNKNRTAGDVRHAFDKYGGSLGSLGCVSYLFKNKGVILVERKAQTDIDSLMMLALDAGAEDVLEEDDAVKIITAPDSYSKIAEILRSSSVEVFSEENTYLPDSYVELNEKQQDTFEKMLDILEDNDDVQEVYHNVQ